MRWSHKKVNLTSYPILNRETVRKIDLKWNYVDGGAFSI
jgi:hypothetical protein